MVSSAGADADKTKRDRFVLWLGIVLAAAGAVYATQSRLSQLTAWESNPALYYASGVPMMTTLDAYYSLRLARLHAAGSFVPHGPAPARHYSRPDQDSPGGWYEQLEPKFLPLLSRTIASAAVVTGSGVDRTGLLLSPLLSGLFMIPLFLCCWRLGVPAAGLMGGLVAAFCVEYYRRTSVGWVDTDALNLFFPWTFSFLVLSMSAAQSRDRLLLISAAAGATLYVFYLWYPKPGLIVVFAGALAVHLWLAGISWRRCALCVAVLIVFANPVQLGDAVGSIESFVDRYLLASSSPKAGASAAILFPSVWATIGEMRSLEWTDSLRLVLGRTDFSAIGLAAFVLFALWRWRSMAALAPMLLLAALALASSRRFILYLAPFVGIGWGLIVCVLVKALLRRTGGEANDAPQALPGRWYAALMRTIRDAIARPAVQTTVAYACVAAIFFVWFAPVSGRGYVPAPAVPAPIFRDLQTLTERLPRDSRMWTWWDLGFAIVDATGFGVYHDGAAQYTRQTNVIAASFVHADQHLLHGLIGFVDREGNSGIERLSAEAADVADLLSRMRDAKLPQSDVPIHVFFTADMLLKFPSMRYLSAQASGQSGESTIGIRWLDCAHLGDKALHCAGRRFDLRTGGIEGNTPGSDRPAAPTQLRRAVIVEGGRVLRAAEYAHASDLTLQVALQAGNLVAVYLLDEKAYRSNLNQMFVLGRFDARYFEEVFNDFPYARAYRVIEAARRTPG